MKDKTEVYLLTFIEAFCCVNTEVWKRSIRERRVNKNNKLVWVENPLSSNISGLYYWEDWEVAPRAVKTMWGKN